MYIDWHSFRDTAYRYTRSTYQEAAEREGAGESAAGVRGFQRYSILPAIAFFERVALPVMLLAALRGGGRPGE
jgi:hypothetical protein